MKNPTEFEILVDGKPMTAFEGQTIAEVLIRHGKLKFRTTRNDADRGLYCNMGVCYECRMVVNGQPDVRTCITPAFSGCRVATQNDGESVVEGGPTAPEDP